MNPPSFIGLRTIVDSLKFMEKLKKVFNVMYVIQPEKVELVAYQLKNVDRLGSISGRTNMRMYHIRVRFDLKNLSWGVSFPKN